ncbi:MAG: endoglucanase, partial [Actinomycetota bacterium]|nr:endoglucanase [Actinomycetota bacterium]
MIPRRWVIAGCVLAAIAGITGGAVALTAPHHPHRSIARNGTTCASSAVTVTAGGADCTSPSPAVPSGPGTSATSSTATATSSPSHAVTPAPKPTTPMPKLKPSTSQPKPATPKVNPTTPAPNPTTGVSAPPPPPGTLALHVAGNRLVNGAGSAIQLHGVNRSGPEYQCVHGLGIFDGPSDDSSLAAIASWHGVNTVRVPLNEDCWLGINGSPNGGVSAAQYQAAIQSYVARLHAHGLYAIVELHWSAPGTFQATRQEVMPDVDHSPTFWSEVASTFKGDPATIFDLFNEPNSINWTCWRDGCDVTSGDGTWRVAGMQSLVTAVRTTGAT